LKWNVEGFNMISSYYRYKKSSYIYFRSYEFGNGSQNHSI